MKVLEILLMNKVFQPGDTISGQVIFQIDKRQKMRELYVEFEGMEKGRVVIHHGRHSHYRYARHRMVSQRKILMQEGEVDPGTYTFDFIFTVPWNVLPSFVGRNAWVTYEVRARVDVPLWFDIKTKRTITICSSRRAYADTPIGISVYDPRNLAHYRRRPGKKKKQRPGFELKIPRSVIFAGQVLEGTVRVFNPTRKKIRKIKLFLNGVEYVKIGHHTLKSKLSRWRRTLPFDQFSEGAPLRFHWPIPRDARGSYRGISTMFYWRLRVQLDVAWAFDTKGEADIIVLR